MLVEKKAFRRFLVTYILSTSFLLGVGGYFYYKLSYSNIIESAVSQGRQNIFKLIEGMQSAHFLRQKRLPDDIYIDIVIYIDKEYAMGNFKIEDPYLDRAYWFNNNKVYYVHNSFKRWGEIDYITFKDISKEMSSLQKNMLLIFLFSFLFIVFIAFALGKMFLRPLKETISFLEEFIADATHEVNTPISNILANIEMIKELNPEFKSSEEFRKVESSALRVSKLFRDLSFASLNHNYSREMENLQLDEVLLDRIEFFSTAMKSKDIEVVSRILPQTLYIDKEDLLRILDNILSNAVKHTKSNGKIEIELDSYLRVVNDGKIDDVKKVLEKFNRGSCEQGGFGLGLYMVKRISDFYKFKLEISSSDKKVEVKIFFSLD